MQITRNTVDLQRRHRPGMAFASLLILALLWTQSLGLWHRVVHFAPAHSANVGMAQAVASDTARTPAPTGKLFANHLADTDCQLFDQLSHADSATATVGVALALAVLPQILRASHGLAVARWHALFQARGPPSLR